MYLKKALNILGNLLGIKISTPFDSLLQMFTGARVHWRIFTEFIRLSYSPEAPMIQKKLVVTEEPPTHQKIF